MYEIPESLLNYIPVFTYFLSLLSQGFCPTTLGKHLWTNKSVLKGAYFIFFFEAGAVYLF